MATLFSQYTSGMQFPAGVIAGSSTGLSGLNPIVDRLNSIAPNGSQISGTAVTILGSTVTTTGVVSAGFVSGNGLDIYTSTFLLAGSRLNQNVYSGTYYYTTPGTSFTTTSTANAYLHGHGPGNFVIISTDIAVAPIELPQNAKVTAVSVFGSPTAIQWEMNLLPVDSSGTSPNILVSGTFDDAITSISGTGVIDNQNNKYWFRTELLTSGVIIRSARITYTI